jgi:hypothetical protein
MPSTESPVDQATARLLALAQRVMADEAVPPDDAATLERDLRQAADSWLVGMPDADQAAIGLKFAHAAISAGVAVKALETAALWRSRPAAPSVNRVVAINTRLARRHLIGALQPLAKIEHGAAPPPPPLPPASSPSVPPSAAPVAADAPTSPNLDVLRNIATYHRAHERFYTQHVTETAVDLYREANKLRIIADVWLGDPATPPGSGVDFTDPLYQAAGCDDLNALPAIPAIGVLFMEGEAEPTEIRVMKIKLQAAAAAKQGAGQWLAAKMVAAWQREQSVFSPGLIAGAQARFNTIATNFCGAMEMALAGRLLGIALARLQRIDFRPAAIRANRAAAGHDLAHAAWIVVMAAQLDARNGASLGENDRNWTAYLDALVPATETAT